jgi:hypothetical protein
VVEMVFIYKVGGVDKEFTEKRFDGNSEGAVFRGQSDQGRTFLLFMILQWKRRF